MSHFNIHPDFKLNGISYSKTELKELAVSFIKEEDGEYEKELGNFLLDWLLPSDEIIVQTSGSTGVPKKIPLLKQHMVNSALATGAFFNLQPKDTVLHCLPLAYIAGKMLLVRALVLGLHIDVIAPKATPINALTKKYDFSAMVPLQLQNSIAFINAIGKLIVGGAPLTKHLKDALQDTSCQIYETYGMTETITHIAARRVNGKNDNYTKTPIAPFQVFPEVKISKDDRNCLVIDAPHISKTSIITNDVVRVISNSEFLWLGRYDNIINSGGIKLIPEQIEAKLKPVIDLPFFVAGIPDERLGQKLVLVLESEQVEDSFLESLAVLDTLSKYELPKTIYQLKTFVYTKTGKIHRSKTLALIEK